MEIEYEHIRKQNAKLKTDKTKAYDSRTLFPHVFRQSTMPMYVFYTSNNLIRTVEKLDAVFLFPFNTTKYLILNYF